MAQPGCAWASAAEAGVAGFTAGQRNGGSDAGKGEIEARGERLEARGDPFLSP